MIKIEDYGYIFFININMDTMAQNNDIIAQCQEEVAKLQSELDKLKADAKIVQGNLDKQTKMLQAACELNGHDYICDRSCDGHSSYDTYTCCVCGHFTMMYPKKFKRV